MVDFKGMRVVSARTVKRRSGNCQNAVKTGTSATRT